MDDIDCPEHVKAFVAGHIESVVQLEVLLLLYASPARSWTADEIGRELRIDAAWVSAQLSQLDARGLLGHVSQTANSFQYRPQTQELDRALVDLARCYTDRRVTIISLIYSKPPVVPAPISDPLRQFSDAFRLRKDNSDR